MKSHLAIIVAAATFVAAPTFAFADCHDQPGKTARISKDGATAPMQDAPGQGGTSEAEGGTTTNMAADQSSIAKDGSTMPMAPAPGSGDAQRATSPQDVEAQQEGEETAMAKAEGTASENCAE